MVRGSGQITAAGRLSLIVLAFLVPAAFSAPAHARGLLAAAEQTRLLAQIDRRPMVFFLAKGSAGSCGPGCGEWIAAEGRFVPTGRSGREARCKPLPYRPGEGEHELA